MKVASKLRFMVLQDFSGSNELEGLETRGTGGEILLMIIYN